MSILVKPYLSLSNILIPSELVNDPPSLSDYLSADNDFELRVRGCELIQEAGVLLRLPQVIAMAATFLASKIDESPRRPRDVINVFHHIRQIENKEKISPLILDQYYINVKTQVIKSERRILKELGFAVHSQHPHKLLIIYLQTLECEKNQKLVQVSWNYLNDSYKTNVFVRFQPPSIACACIYLAARHLQFPLPNNPAWYTIFNVTLMEIQEICQQLFKLYTRTPVSLKNLDKALNGARKLYELNRLRSNIEATPLHDSPNFTLPNLSTIEAKSEPLAPPMVFSSKEFPLFDDNNNKKYIETPPEPQAYDNNSSRPKDEISLQDSRDKPNKLDEEEIDQDALLLAQQRQSLLFSIQEQKHKKRKFKDRTGGAVVGTENEKNNHPSKVTTTHSADGDRTKGRKSHHTISVSSAIVSVADDLSNSPSTMKSSNKKEKKKKKNASFSPTTTTASATLSNKINSNKPKKDKNLAPFSTPTTAGNGAGMDYYQNRKRITISLVPPASSSPSSSTKSGGHHKKHHSATSSSKKKHKR